MGLDLGELTGGAALVVSVLLILAETGLLVGVLLPATSTLLGLGAVTRVGEVPGARRGARGGARRGDPRQRGVSARLAGAAGLSHALFAALHAPVAMLWGGGLVLLGHTGISLWL